MNYSSTKSDAPNMQSYSSPNSLAADGTAPFYGSANNQHQMSNPDELQLTAQLSRNLAPTMNAGPGGNMSEDQDGTVHEGIPHFGQEQEEHHHPIQPAHRQIDQLAAQYPGGSGSTAPRKRSKVSRACDECRRKKIRCDATGEQGDDQCSSCKRVGARCQFSRVPMKRGPSKGYIKELADRLNHLEGAIHAGEPPSGSYMSHPEISVPARPSEEMSPQTHGDMTSRKRTYSNISADFNTSYQLQRPTSGYESSRQQQDSANIFNNSQGAPVPQMFREPNYSPNGLPPSPHWKKQPEQIARNSSFEGFQSGEFSQLDQSADWDDNIVNGYYANIHPTFPILAQSKASLNNRISACPSLLKDAFYDALHAAVESSSMAPAHPSHQNFKKATQLVLSMQFQDTTARSALANLVYLQTMLLLAIASINNASRGRGGTSRIWLSTAVFLAYEIKLHKRSFQRQPLGDDLDSEENLLRKVWWSLVILDRWHSSNISTPPLIPDESLVVHPEDQFLLGDSIYHLCRLSIILGHFSAATLVSEDLPMLGVKPLQLLHTVLRGELERWRETLPVTVFPPNSSPIVLMCYWHVRILLERRLSELDKSQLLTDATNIANLVSQNALAINPLTDYCTEIACGALVDLMDEESTRESAGTTLRSLLESNALLPGSVSAVREKIGMKKHAGGENSATETAELSLRRLADLATATEEGDESTNELHNDNEQGSSMPLVHQELKDAVNDGYLNALSRETAGSVD